MTATFSIFVPGKGGVYDYSSTALGFTDQSQDIKKWKTSRGAHGGIAIGMRDAVGDDLRNVWRTAEVLPSDLVVQKVEAMRKERWAAFDAESKATAAAQLQAMERRWEKSGATITIEGVDGAVVDRRHFGIPKIDDVIHQVVSDVRALAHFDPTPRTLRLVIKGEALPGVLEALLSEPEAEGRGPRKVRDPSAPTLLQLAKERDCTYDDSIAAFEVFIGDFILLADMDDDEVVFWWGLCWQDAAAGFFPDDGGGPLLEGGTISELRAQLAARRREPR